MSSIRRSVQVMELLARKSPLGVRAIAAQLELPLGSVHRLLLDFEEGGIVERTAEDKWELSFKLLEITGLQLDRIHFPALCRPFAEKIAEATRETVNVNVLNGLHGVCVDKVRGNENMQLDMRIGSLGSLHYGGAGKAMLAFLNEADQRRVIDGPLERLTPKTLTDRAALRRELKRIRDRGYSIDDQEVVIGVYCVSVPILDAQSRPVGAMSVTGPTPKAPGPMIMSIVGMLNEACGHVSRKLGYRGEYPLGEAVAPSRRRA